MINKIGINGQCVNVYELYNYYQQMLYLVQSPYYRQFLSSGVNKKFQKNMEKAQGGPVAENRGAVHPGSVGV